ncbi:MAG: hypothetical protein FWG10_10410 [Eubacteriaceae bacterium]|nr:hypothetical protein [Eubacteriaceae bacterium]
MMDQAFYLVLGIVIGAVAIFLILLLRRLTETVTKLNEIVAQNTAQINSIVVDVGQITSDTKNIVGKVNGTVNSVNDIVGAVHAGTKATNVLNIKKMAEYASITWSGIGFIRRVFSSNRKTRKEKSESR